MSKRIVAYLTVGLLAATAAQAQSNGGGGGRGHGGRGGHSQGPADPAPANTSARTPAPTPLGKVEIVGVIQAVDPEADRVTIAYEAVTALNWPAGKMPFVVSKTALLNGVTVGEKVRFRLESQQISDLRPF